MLHGHLISSGEDVVALSMPDLSSDYFGPVEIPCSRCNIASCMSCIRYEARIPERYLTCEPSSCLEAALAAVAIEAKWLRWTVTGSECRAVVSQGEW